MIMKMKFDKIVVDDDLMMLLATADDDHANHKKYHSLQRGEVEPKPTTLNIQNVAGALRTGEVSSAFHLFTPLSVQVFSLQL